MPYCARVVTPSFAEPFENRPDAPVSTRYEGLEIRLAWGLRVEFDTGAPDASQRRTEDCDLALEARRVLHRIPLEGRPRLRHKRVERHGDVADALLAGARAFENASGQVGDFDQVLVALLGQTDHEVQLEAFDTATDQHLGRVEDFGLGEILVDNL